VREVIGNEGALLVGVDLKKSPALLHAAYNDAAGVTAAFNLNLLTRMNRELDADFDIAAFRHHAFFDPLAGRVEMHLLSLKAQSAHIGEFTFNFRADETIHTEISCKYSTEEFHEIAAEVGFAPLKVWVDDARLFSVHLLSA
jgi:L-histidine Nalpha-methyltransferase